jgi:hypothetical protein
MWLALVRWAHAANPPPARWRRDIGLMGGETSRRIAWLVEQDPRAAVCWDILEAHLILARALSEREPPARRVP